MILKLKIGLDNLTFGMTQYDVIGIFGKADRIKIDSDDDSSSIWEFNNHKIRLTFYMLEDNRFGYFRSINPKLLYNGHQIIGLKIDFVKKEIFGQIINQWEIDEYDFLTTHFNEKYWLTLHEEYGIVTAFEMGVPFKNEEEFDWPE